MSATNSEAPASLEDAFFALRSRAYELADTGRHKHWSKLAYALLAEGFEPSLVKRLNADTLAVPLITRSCRLASAANPASPSFFRKWFGVLLPRPL
jgi:hypothetical protein